MRRNEMKKHVNRCMFALDFSATARKTKARKKRKRTRHTQSRKEYRNNFYLNKHNRFHTNATKKNSSNANRYQTRSVCVCCVYERRITENINTPYINIGIGNTQREHCD